MEAVSREETDEWFLAGKPVVRLWGKDFEISPEKYVQWLTERANNYGIGIVVKQFIDPPGVVMQAYIKGTKVPKLVDPQLKVTRVKFPYLYCTYKGCVNRIAAGMPPGGTCENHERAF